MRASPDLPRAEKQTSCVIMNMTIDQIVEETRSLPHDVVMEMVDRILMAAHGGQQPEHARAWSATVQRRVAEIRSGQVEGIPGEVTAAKIRQIVGR
jgi:Putative addiction module component